MLCNYADKSCDHEHCDGGDVPRDSREHMFKGLCEFMGGIPSKWVTFLPCLMTIGLVQAEI